MEKDAAIAFLIIYVVSCVLAFIRGFIHGKREAEKQNDEYCAKCREGGRVVVVEYITKSGRTGMEIREDSDGDE